MNSHQQQPQQPLASKPPRSKASTPRPFPQAPPRAQEGWHDTTATFDVETWDALHYDAELATLNYGDVIRRGRGVL